MILRCFRRFDYRYAIADAAADLMPPLIYAPIFAMPLRHASMLAFFVAAADC